jgi:hypothetical protein
MARRRRSRRSRRSLGALGEPITGSLLFIGVPLLLLWLASRRKGDAKTAEEGSDDGMLPTQTSSEHDIADEHSDTKSDEVRVEPHDVKPGEAVSDTLRSLKKETMTDPRFKREEPKSTSDIFREKMDEESAKRKPERKAPTKKTSPRPTPRPTRSPKSLSY